MLLFIGDGMALAQRALAEYAQGHRLVMNDLPHQGITTTHSANQMITDSAAAATAIACGQKTLNGVVGMGPDLSPIPSVAEMARDKGMKVGIVTSVSLDHATPAAFYAHVKSRKLRHEIALFMAESGFDFLAGGGLLDPEGRLAHSAAGQAGGQTAEQAAGQTAEQAAGQTAEQAAGQTAGQAPEQGEKAPNALAVAEENGYRIVADRAAFLALKPGDGKIIARNPWLQEGAALPYAIDAREDGDITLAEFTRKAIEMLSADAGFFLMVEGGKIDWACHANDPATMVAEVLAFDAAVRAGLDFYLNHPEDTLLVVTGDHECGGLALGSAGSGYRLDPGILGKQRSSHQHFIDTVLKGYTGTLTGIMEPVTAHFGFTFSKDTKKDPMALNPRQIERLTTAFDAGPKDPGAASKDRRTYLLYGGKAPVAIALCHIMSEKAGIGWTAFGHTAAPVVTSAIGAGAERFDGYFDNADIGLNMMAIMGFAEAEAPSK